MVSFARSAALAAGLTVLWHAPASALTQQQELMKTCSTNAGSQKLKGSARKTYMAGCLKGDAAAPAPRPLTAQQEKMKTCNADASAKSLKGKERRTFMSTCLKG